MGQDTSAKAGTVGISPDDGTAPRAASLAAALAAQTSAAPALSFPAAQWPVETAKSGPPPLHAGGAGTVALPAGIIWPSVTAMPPMPSEKENEPQFSASEPEVIAASEVAADQSSAPARRPAKRRPAGPARTRVAANDDIPTIGALIYALEQKPSSKPFRVATYASAGWALLGLFFGYAMLAPEISKAAGFWDLLARPTLLTLSATVVLPIVIFYFLATLVWRAQELKLMSSAMTEVAVRLAEPDRGAEQSVSSLGQTVRKQVHFMNEAVSQAIGRAGELEAMVHSEVSNLERSFQENETRIRKVLAELANERTQLVSTSNEVHTTLRAMGDEVPGLIEKLNGQQGKLARIIESAGQNLIALEGSLLKASDKLEGTLSDRTGHLQQVLDEYTGAINQALGNRTSEMQAVFHEYTKALDTTLTQRSEELSHVLASRTHDLDAAIVDRTRALDGAFAERLQLFDESIMRSTSTIDSVIGEKATALSSAMETHARQLADTLGRQSVDIDETLMHGIDAVRRSSENITKQSVKAIEGLSGQADMLRSVSENLLNQIGGVTNRFENQGQSIMRAANALETANFRIDSTLKTRHAELNDTLQKLTGKATELDAVMQGYSANIEGSMSAAETRARSLTHELSRTAETHARTTLADLERMRMETEQQASRTLTDMHSQFSTVGREMSAQMGTLSSRLSETSEDLRQKTQRAAAELQAEQERLRAEAERIPLATRESTDAMRRVLNEQIRALDKLTTYSNKEGARRDVMPPVAPGIGRPPGALPPPASLASAWAENQARLATQQSQQPQSGSMRQAQAAQTQSFDPNQSNRWSLGDLLSRASDAPQQPAPPVTVISEPHPAAAPGAPINLEIIAAALDPDTAAAIWSRYRAGQRGIMVRSIYSPEGRSTFDEVVRRYGHEQVFRGTVDKFLVDFERLLRESEARDASGRTVESHLSSPSGRTYLFLSHAAGRLN